MLKKEKELISKRESLLKELLKSKTWITGSIIETTRIQSGTEKPFYYLSRSIAGKTNTTYLSKNDLVEFKAARITGLEIQKILTEILELNIKLLKIKGKSK
jgi:hypothetical protein